MFNKDEMLTAVKNGGLIAAGLIGGREISRKLFPDDSEGFKRYLGAIIQAGGGIVLIGLRLIPLLANILN